MDVYKEYLYEISKIEYQTPYLMLIWDYTPQIFKRCIPMIINIPFEEGKYNAYYGAVKKICYGFVFSFSNCIYSSKAHCERFRNNLTYTELTALFNNTVTIHKTHHSEVLQDFETINSERERLQLEEIISLHTNYMAELAKFGEKVIKCDKEKDIHAFAQDHLEVCIQRTYEIGEFTRGFLAKIIALRLCNIRVSLQDILHRVKTNSSEFHKEYEIKMDSLFQEMYDCNKESLNVSRRSKRNSREAVEVQKKIDTVRHKIENFGNLETFNRLASEIQYWSHELRDFEEIAGIITKVKTALDRAKEQAQIYGNYRTTEAPGRRATCWDVMGQNFEQVVEDLEKKYVEVCKPIITFFACTGINRLRYYDDIGAYFIDEFGHPNYYSNCGTKVFHVNCDGKFLENLEDDKYYFDKCGRHLLENGEKVYQLAPCTTKFRKNIQGWFEKFYPCECQHKCGHVTEPCLIDVQDMAEVIILPKAEPIDIKNTLDAETVKYLWDAFGYILPDVLYEVYESQSKNPIHQLAHVLMHKKYSRTPEETREKKMELEKYRADILKKRHDKSEAMISHWKSKQFKPVKAADLEDTQEEIIFQSNLQEQLMSDVNEYSFPYDPPGASSKGRKSTFSRFGTPVPRIIKTTFKE